MVLSSAAATRRLIAVVLTSVAIAAAAGNGFAADTAAVVRRGKAATALVDVQSQEFGTAFCVDAGGFFLTNAHVVQRAAKGGKLSLVLDPGEATQRVVGATVVRSDPQADLALLRAGGVEGLTALAWGDADGLVETAPVTAFGYPFGKLLAGAVGNAPAGADRPAGDGTGGGGDYPSVSVSTGRITSLRKSAGRLQRIQLDASLNPGNSGGPVLDEQGNVIGVVVSGVLGSGVNFAIPSGIAKSFLEAPLLEFEPRPIPYAKRHEVRPLTVRVVTFGTRETGQAPPAVEVTLKSPGTGERKFVGKADPSAPGLYRVDASPLPAPADPEKVRVTATFGDGSVSGLARGDVALRAGAKQLKLQEVRSVDTAGQAAVTLADGGVLAGAPGGLEAVEVDFGGLVATLDLGKARRIEVAPAAPINDRVEYRVTASRDGKVLAEAAGTLPIEAAPSAAASGGPVAAPDGGGVGGAGAVPPPLRSDDRVDVKLPSTVDDVAVGGGGRFLILTLKKLNKIAVFDVNAAKIVQYVAIPPANVRVAAGAEKLFIILVDQKVVQRWSLTTTPPRRELTTTLPFDGVVQAAAMGSASTGPLLLRWSAATDALAPSKFEFFDAATLKRVDAGPLNTGHYSVYRDNVHVRAAANGTTFGLWATSHSPTGMASIIYGGGRASIKYEHTSVGFVVPGPDGRNIFTGAGGVYTEELRRLGAAVGGAGDGGPPSLAATIPGNVPGYYITLPQSPFPGGNTGRPDSAKRPTGAVCLVGRDRPLVTLPEMPELPTSMEPWAVNDFTFDKRVHFLPGANLLITIPASNDSLVLRRFNVLAELEKSGIDYLFVSSVPPPTARPGELYRYPIEVKSKQGGVRFRLESGPEGMTVSADGVVTWQVPAAAGDASVIITVSDASGQEVFHTFDLAPGSAAVDQRAGKAGR